MSGLPGRLDGRHACRRRPAPGRPAPMPRMSTAPCSTPCRQRWRRATPTSTTTARLTMSGGHPAVEQQDGEGEGGAGAGAAPPAVAAEGDQVADDDAGQHGQRPADGAGREERVAAGEGPVEAGAEDERRPPRRPPRAARARTGAGRCSAPGRPEAASAVRCGGVPRRSRCTVRWRAPPRPDAPKAARPHRLARHAPVARRSRESGAALSVGSIPVPLTAGGAHATRPDARQPSTAPRWKTLPLARQEQGDAPTAAGHGRCTPQQ